MNKKAMHVVLLSLMLTMIFCGCSKSTDAAETTVPVSNGTSVSQSGVGGSTESETEMMGEMSDEQVICAVMNYCYTQNPDLERIVKAQEYPVYWEISSRNAHETVVLFRSYTGAQNRYYIDLTTGDTYVTEFVPGITAEEQRTDERFNIRDYLSAD